MPRLECPSVSAETLRPGPQKPEATLSFYTLDGRSPTQPGAEQHRSGPPGAGDDIGAAWASKFVLWRSEGWFLEGFCSGFMSGFDG